MDYEEIAVPVLLFLTSILIPLSIALLDKKIKYAALSFCFSFLLPIISYYFPFSKINLFEITLISFLTLVSAFSLLEIKIKQYKAALISTPKLWVANILIFLCAAELPILRMLWENFIHGQDGGLDTLFITAIMLAVTVPTGMLFLICSTIQISALRAKKNKLSLPKTPSTSE